MTIIPHNHAAQVPTALQGQTRLTPTYPAVRWKPKVPPCLTGGINKNDVTPSCHSSHALLTERKADSSPFPLPLYWGIGPSDHTKIDSSLLDSVAVSLCTIFNVFTAEIKAASLPSITHSSADVCRVHFTSNKRKSARPVKYVNIHV